MKVELMSHTLSPEKLIGDAARVCYQSEGSNNTVLIEKLIQSGHTSVLEHAKFTFKISEVSRVLTHQLVRHRIASYSQESQRYVHKGGFNFVTPDRIKRAGLEERYSFYVKQQEQAYSFLIEKLMNKGYSEKEAIESARYLLPNAVCSEIVATFNYRSLWNFFTLRCCDRAQNEIQKLAYKMLKICKRKAPSVFEKAGAKCVRDNCQEHLKCERGGR